jgi:hypothetical protein
MIKFVGSSYQYQGEVLTTPEIIFIEDHHYNEELRSFPVQKLLENSTCGPRAHTLVFDHVLRHDDVLSDYCCVFLPLLLARYTNQFIQQNIIPNWTNKTQTFNFMINKTRIHRNFLLMLLEHFELNNYEYTLCWKHNTVNRSRMIIEAPQYQDIIEQAKLTISNRQYLFGTERLLDQGLQYGSITNPEVYQTFLQQAVFEPTCYSLITEPAFYERETIVTEKTIMAIYGGTMPIWVGGWRIADWMRDQGFDVFDDLIDHSYQDLADPYDRCYHAIYKNYELLNDFETSKKVIEYSQDRLQHNLDLLKQNQFQTECQAKIDALGVKLF